MIYKTIIRFGFYKFFEVGEQFNREITDEEADEIETVQDIFDVISN